MRRLILVRHSETVFCTDLPTTAWPLTPRGRRRAERLARRLERYAPSFVASSPEPKAVQTAEIVCSHLQLDHSIEEGLRESDRQGVPIYPAEAEFEAALKRWFDRPTERCMGRETADEAHCRFAAAVNATMEASSRTETNRGAGNTVLMVSHGAVIALCISRATDADPFPIWKRFGMPAYAVLSFPRLRLLEMVEQVSMREEI